jgi:glycosyltransferase involved in cell wall biosynthesis
MKLAPPKPPQVIVAQIGARMHYAVPVLLHRAGMLAHCYTDAYVGPGSPWYPLARGLRLLPEAWRPEPLKRLLGRRADGLPPEKVTAFNLAGLFYSLALSRAHTLESQSRVYKKYGRPLYDLILTHHAFPRADMLYAFHGALPLLNRAADLGMVKILEMYIAPVATRYALLSEEHRRWPGWEFPLPEPRAWDEGVALDLEECRLADILICPSEFVAAGCASLGPFSPKTRLVPYGVDLAAFAGPRLPWDGRRPLRLLFAGGATLRKGVQYLDQALQQLNGIPLATRLVGGVAIQQPYRGTLARRAELIGQVPRHKVKDHYAWADLFVFPSICEGSATVTYEALAAGLPVITTPHAGSVVRDGVDGFIVPIRDSEALAAKIELLAANQDLLAWMSQNARQRAAEFSWERYGERLINLILHVTANKKNN